ncbi:RNA-binding domain-containing protein [Tricholoma matsutake]|nr:RNA-binding domain-containing protein [Tricholoma matsutake 945]
MNDLTNFHPSLLFSLPTAWQSQDIAPSGISIPTHGSAMAPEEQWSANGNGGPATERDLPSRRSRSRSPGGGGARDDRGERGERGANPGNNLHVSGLSHKVDTRELEATFAKIGRVKKASVMYDPHTRDSRGFGFVTMQTAEEADAVITALNGTEFMGKVMNVEKARRGRARTPTPGRYYGPPKRNDFERPYDPRPYDSRYSRDYDRRGGGGRYDDYRGGGRDRDYDRGGYRDYDRGDRDRDRGDRYGARDSREYERRDYGRY